MSCAQGYNDNSGLGPILADYLQDDSDQGQILVLMINKFDHQMNEYFSSTHGGGGMMCDAMYLMGLLTVPESASCDVHNCATECAARAHVDAPRDAAKRSAREIRAKVKGVPRGCNV